MTWTRLIAATILALGLLPGTGRAAEIEGQHIRLPATERQVDVTYFRAPGDAPRPAVLLLHGARGFDGQLAGYDHYCSELANHGMDAYLVYYYDANDQRSMSTGTDVFMVRYEAWAKLVDDLAGDVLADKSSNGRVGLIGFSNGGILATGASVLDTRFNAAVIYYGSIPFPIATRMTRFPPLLVLHGDADAVIPVERGKELAAIAKKLGGSAELVIYRGIGHGFGARLNTKEAADALARSIAFLTTQLGAHSP